jgi:diguanylate cyclase (GGDEF)-like protein
VVLVDIDDFKQVNDRHGHLVGDEVLADLGRVIQRTLRAGEQTFRIGGEEFAIVVEEGIDAGARIGQRVRVAVTRQRRGRMLPTISAGVAATGDPDGLADVLERADKALYAAKHAGKNRVVVDRGGVIIAAPPLEQERPSDDPAGYDAPLRVLLVEDDEGLRALLRATFEVADIEVDEAGDARQAAQRIEHAQPDIVILDIGLPGLNGLEFCRRLKESPATRGTRIVLLTGADATQEAGRAAGADALLRKPFSPLELLNIVEQLAEGSSQVLFETDPGRRPDEQLLLYAQDLRRLREIERGQRLLLQRAYRETVTALASALESKDTGTREHSQRVQRYALELAARVEPSLLDDPSVEYGFLLHDIGKIGIPDRILQKPEPLTVEERRLMQTHPVLGEQMLGQVALLQGEGISIVRCHHERWDGRGYPDGLRGDDIPLGARVFAVADALDAITDGRVYRPAQSWDEAVAEIARESGKQFDPSVVAAFESEHPRLRRIHLELTA